MSRSAHVFSWEWEQLGSPFLPGLPKVFSQHLLGEHISPVTHTDLLAFLIISQTSLSLTRALVLATSFTGKLFFPGSYSVYFFMFFRFFLKFNLIISEVQYI